RRRRAVLATAPRGPFLRQLGKAGLSGRIGTREAGQPVRKAVSGAKFAFAVQEQQAVREGRKERERASCRAQLAALQSRFAADCEGAAEQARLYISRLLRLSRTLMLLIYERLFCALLSRPPGRRRRFDRPAEIELDPEQPAA